MRSCGSFTAAFVVLSVHRCVSLGAVGSSLIEPFGQKLDESEVDAAKPKAPAQSVLRLEADSLAAKGESDVAVLAVPADVPGVTDATCDDGSWVAEGSGLMQLSLGPLVKLGRCLAVERLVRTHVVEFLLPALELASLCA